MNSLRKATLLAQFGKRIVTAERNASVSSKIKAKQEQMQIPDGRPVHLKGGVGDTLLMQTTFLLCTVGLGLCFKLYYDLSVPKK